MCHESHPTKQLKGVHQQFHTKSYSDLFECPVCGLRRRFNLNYLGNRRIPMCDGEKVTASERMDFPTWRALTDKANSAAARAAGVMESQTMTDAGLIDLARHFDLNGECEDNSDAPRKPEKTAVCGSELAEFAREAAKRCGVDVADFSDDDLLAISHSIAPLADCGNDDKIEMLVGDELAKFARAVMAEAAKKAAPQTSPN